MLPWEASQIIVEQEIQAIRVQEIFSNLQVHALQCTPNSPRATQGQTFPFYPFLLKLALEDLVFYSILLLCVIWSQVVWQMN